MQLPIFLLLLFFSSIGLLPLEAQEPDYHRADSIALNLSAKRFISSKELVYQLTADLPTQHEKARAIFRWITANISYDQKELRKLEKNGFAPIRKKFRSEAHAKKWESQRYYKKVNSALHKRKAVCEGYSMLFKHLCSWANIEAEVVIGHGRTPGNKIGKYQKPIHAWNAVKLDGNWHLLDATWASGHVAELTDRFVFDFREYYFLTPPEPFNTNHYPKKKEWLLHANAPSVKTFYTRPISLPGYFTNRITNYSPQEGILRAEPGETVSIRLYAHTKPITEVSIYRSDKHIRRKVKPLSYELVQVASNEWEVQICFPEKGNFPFTLYLNGAPSLQYQATIRSD